jgi:NAD(P)-dependent dehydrogenase (short-subunit alcohol dehydrogenase family)
MRSVVITGTSTGIGRACALILERTGYQVFAGVRAAKDGDSLRSESRGQIIPIHLDLTEEASIAAAYRTVADAVGDAGLSGLVNNAGTTVPCPVEYLALAEFRRQLEVNLIGHLAVIQTFLPLLRLGTGRIVNVSSVGGKVGGPFMAPYSVAKHGIEGLSDTLRLELLGSGIQVSIIEPGFISTAMRGKLLRDTQATVSRLPPEGRSRYAGRLEKMAATVDREAAHGSLPEVVARAVAHALGSRKPRVRYPVGAGARRLLLLRRILPDRWMDRLLLRALGSS